jgi:hypothetical protein
MAVVFPANEILDVPWDLPFRQAQGSSLSMGKLGSGAFDPAVSFGCVIAKLLVNVRSFMSFARCAGLILTGGALLFSISCEKHELGEYPEVQKEQMTLADNPKPAPSPGGSATATPVNFFPEKRP